MTPSALVRLRRVSALAVSPDGAAAVVVVERLDADEAKYVSDLWWLPLDGGPARQLTRGDSRDRAPAFLADGTLVFLSDRVLPGATKGDEAKTQIWALPAHGEAYALSDEPHGVSDFKVAGAVVVALVELWPGVALEAQRKTAADRKKLGPSLLRFRAQPVRFWDRWLGPGEPRLVAFDVAEGRLERRRELTPDAGGDVGAVGAALREHSWDLSPDGAWVAVTWAVMSQDDRIHDKPLALIATSDGTRVMLGAGPGNVHAAPRFLPDGSGLVAQRYRRTRDGYAPRTLWRYEVAAGQGRSGTELTGAWDRWPGPWGVVGGQAVTTAEDEGRSPVFLVDVASGDVRAVGPTAVGSWDFVALVPGRNEVVGIRSGLLSPPEVWRMDLASGVLLPLAGLSGHAEPEGVGTRFREVRVGVAPRDDGRERVLAAFVVEPAAGNGKTVVWIHGGPVAAWGDHWHWRWCALLMASRGYRVVLPNPSGSTGYGLDWVNDIWGNCWGDRCYDDLMRLFAYLEGEGIAAADTVVMGGSFGGYMTNWIGARGGRFHALVTHASVYSLAAFHGVTDMPAWWELMMGGAPWSDAEYERYSPSRYVAGWKTPVLVIHGEKDYRVPIGEGLALFEALQAHGVPSELAVFPDENHWILKPKNIEAWYEMVLEFIGRPAGRA